MSAGVMPAMSEGEGDYICCAGYGCLKQLTTPLDDGAAHKLHAIA
jgi:hypothetical protein